MVSSQKGRGREKGTDYVSDGMGPTEDKTVRGEGRGREEGCSQGCTVQENMVGCPRKTR